MQYDHVRQTGMNLQQIESGIGINHADAIQQTIYHSLLEQHSVKLIVKRDDLLHPIVSGNKWRKLKYCIYDALVHGHEHLISMGGAWSNHLHALAYVGKQLNIKTTGLVRGDEKYADSPTLQDMHDWGMNIRFVERGDFRQLRSYRLANDPPATTYQGYWLPEGGASMFALTGMSELALEINADIDQLFVACGTGTTLAGLIAANVGYRLTGIAVLRSRSFLEKDIYELLGNTPSNADWSLNYNFHCGGYARSTDQLLAFIDDFEQQSGVPIEPVYTGKLFYAIFQLINAGKIAPGSILMALHSGGLQGKRQRISRNDTQQG